MLNSRDIGLLRGDVAANCRIFLERCKKAGLPVLVTGTVRDREYQEQCYKNGTAKTKVPSFHAAGAGLAFDICKNVRGEEYSDLSFFQSCAAIGREMGFEWGGDWKSFPDRPHFQWSGPNHEYTSRDVVNGNLPPDMPLWGETNHQSEEEEDMAVIYHYTEEVPEWGRRTIQKLLDKGYFTGAAADDLKLSEEMLRIFVVLDRAGVFGG